MTFKKQRHKQARLYRKVFGLAFIAAHKAAKAGTLRLEDVSHLSQSVPVFEPCSSCGYSHCVVKVTALDSKVYTFVDGVLW